MLLTRSRGPAAAAARLTRANPAVDLPADGAANAEEAVCRACTVCRAYRAVAEGGARRGARGADSGGGQDGGQEDT